MVSVMGICMGCGAVVVVEPVETNSTPSSEARRFASAKEVGEDYRVFEWICEGRRTAIRPFGTW